MAFAQKQFPSFAAAPTFYMDGFPRYAKLRECGLVQGLSERQFRKFRLWKKLW